MSDRDVWIRSILQRPDDAVTWGAYSDWLRDAGDEFAADQAAACRIVVGDLEREVGLMLPRLRFTPGSWDKRFARNLAMLISAPVLTVPDDTPVVSARQEYHLLRMCFRYRKQDRRLLWLAHTWAAHVIKGIQPGDLLKYPKASEEEAARQTLLAEIRRRQADRRRPVAVPRVTPGLFDGEG